MTPSEDRPKTPVIETAAGTTSPENARSGNFAYIVALATIVVLGLMGAGVSGCMRLTTSLAQDFDYGDTSNDLGDDYLDDDFFDQFDYQDDGTDAESDDDGLGLGSHSVKDVLGGDLKLYSFTIDSCLPAMDYANAQQPVRDFVRGLVIADRDATSDIATQLRTAAWNDDDLSVAIQNAQTRAQQAVEDIRAMQLPAVNGDNASSVSHGLEVGKSDALKRWEAIQAELDLFAANETITSSEPRDIDNDLQDSTYDAAESFSSALSDSAAI